MSDKAKAEFISVFNTFLATFVLAVGSSLVSGDIMWTGAFWTSVVLAAGRSGVKAVINSFVPKSLGGRK